MAKMIRHDFGGIHDALNSMIIAEVKAALELLPEQMYQSPSMCRIVVSDNGDYSPKDVAVDVVWLHKGQLCFDGHLPLPDYADDNDEPEIYEGGEEDGTDWLDITDMGYLIDQIASEVDGDKTYNLPNKSMLTCGYVAELSLKTAIEELVTV